MRGQEPGIVGMMTRRSIMAREYGIPAVVGLDRATER
jgi:phosphohistidine swiveling domain-containing protein